MQKLFSTEGIGAKNQFHIWQEFARERFIPFAQTRLNEGAFHATLEGANVGSLILTRSTFDPVRLEMTPQATRRSPKRDSVAVVLRIAGTVLHRQYDRCTVQRPGEITVMDSREPVVSEFRERTEALLIELPRERIERLLGPARIFAAITGGADLPATRLARTFFADLLDVHASLSPDLAERMGSVGVDLIVASLAERMALETPKPLQATVTVQRAKAYVEANLGDVTLDPAKIAAAVGVSLRQLHQLFHDHGHYVSDWMWGRRLETAAQQLASPAQLHLAIGTIAYGCGFTSQAHFSTRFKRRYGVSPRDYRHMVLIGTAETSR